MEESSVRTAEGRFMEPLQLAGKIIIENGGETYRVEETICRMGEGFGLNEVECFAVPSGLFITYRGENGELESGVKRVRQQERNLTRVDEVNRVSRSVAAGHMTCEEALARLREIERMPGAMPGAWGIVAVLVCSGGFTLLFGGGWREVALAVAVACLVFAVMLLVSLFHLKRFASAMMGGFLTALLPHLVSLLLPGIMTDTVIAGALMPLVPGLAMTNAVEDAMRGDTLSGMTNATQAILTACLVAGGAMLAAPVIRLISGGG